MRPFAPRIPFRTRLCVSRLASRIVLRAVPLVMPAVAALVAPLIPLLGLPTAGAQPLGLLNDRAHPELKWMEFETEHFIVIHPRGLEDVAVRAATVAEQVYTPITRGLEHEMGDKTSIVLSDEDQIINGFALPGKMFIWVGVNDYARAFGGNDKWLRQVIAHEFQHNVWQDAARDWTGLISLLRTPAWFVEGLAEYQTEKWGAGRSDLVLRGLFLRNEQNQLDPHDSGFSKVRYLAEQYGDSVLVQAVRKRNALGLADFHGGFRKAAGITVAEFEEEWRRVATAHTYVLYAQKEEVGEVGEHVKTPVPRVSSLAYAPDGETMAVLFHPPGQLPVLATVTTDSTQTVRVVDHGRIDADFAFSGDGRHLVYAKFHRADHGSLLWDLKVADLWAGNHRWITESRRASHPHWSPVADRIVYTAIDGPTTNLYTCDPAGGSVEPLTDHPPDVQVFSPRFSPDGREVSYARFDPGRGIDLAVVDLEGGRTRWVTRSEAHDLKPLWTEAGARLHFTSDRNDDEVPNLYTVPADGSEVDVEVVSDVGEALFGKAVDPRDGSVLALGLASVDTVRLRRIPPDRRTEAVDPVIEPRFVSWRDREPPHPLAPIDFTAPPERTEARPYRAWRRLRVDGKLILPSPLPWGVLLGGYATDLAHHHGIVLGADLGTRDGGFTLRGLYARWDTNTLPLGAPGFFGAYAAVDARFGLRIYDSRLLWDQQTSFGFRWRWPFNFGERIYANHDLEAFCELADVEVQSPEDFDPNDLQAAGLPVPRARYRENRVGVTYRYVKSRPHPPRYAHKRTGHGVFAELEIADPALGSDTEFRRVTLDASKVFGVPVLGGGLFVRGRGRAVWGEAAPQDFTGLRRDVPILPQRYDRPWVISDLIDLDESYFLRGFPRNVPGDQAVVTTVEWRVPLLPRLPVSAFGFSLGGLTGVFFHDHGRVWEDGARRIARHAVGWELRLPLTFGGRTLVVPSYGEGQLLEWERGEAPFERDAYFRIAMVQPF